MRNLPGNRGPIDAVPKTVKAMPRVALVALVAVSACGGVRDAIHARPLPAAGFDARELVDVLPVGRIPAIDRPRFESAAQAEEWLGGQAPVVVLSVGQNARAYPLAILLWHEIVNDVVGGRPVVVAYSPLTGAAAAFDRRVAGRAERFDVSGKLYRSDLVMFDERTRSLWPLLIGRAVAGRAKDARLEQIPAQVASLASFRASFPTGTVLSRQTGSARAYGFNPYRGYLSRTAPFPSFFAPRAEPRLRPMDRVVGVSDAAGSRAYPIAALRRTGVLAERTAGRDIVALWESGTRSAIDDASVARGRDVGSTGVFIPVAGRRHLDFEALGAGFRDRQTGSEWTILGVATAGPLKGRHLQPVTHTEAFWFAWAAFRPGTSIAGS